MGRRDNSLPGGLADQEEVIRICRDYIRINHCAGHWVSKALSVITLEESLIYPLVHEDYHDLDIVFRANLFDCTLNLRQFVHEDGFALGLTDTITVNDHVLRENSVFVFELNESFFCNRLEAIAEFLSFVLHTGSGPESGCSMIDTSAESQDRLLSTTNFMENVNTANHSWGIKVGKVRDSPWFSSNLGTNLNEDFVADTSYVFATRNSVD